MPDNYLPTLPTSTPTLGQPQDQNQGFDPLATRDLPAGFGLTNFQDLKNYQPPAQTKPSVWQTVMQSIGQGLQGYGYATMNPEQQQIYNQNEQAKGAQAAKIAQLRQQQQDQQTANEQFQQTRADKNTQFTAEMNQKQQDFQATKNFQEAQLAQTAGIRADQVAEYAKAHQETAFNTLLGHIQQGNYTPEQIPGLVAAYKSGTGVQLSAEGQLGLMNSRVGANDNALSNIEPMSENGIFTGVKVINGKNITTYAKDDPNNPPPPAVASAMKAYAKNYIEGDAKKTQNAVEAAARITDRETAAKALQVQNTARDNVLKVTNTERGKLADLQTTVATVQKLAMNPNDPIAQSQIPGMMQDAHRELGGAINRSTSGTQSFVGARGISDNLAVWLNHLKNGATLTAPQVTEAADILRKTYQSKVDAINGMHQNAIAIEESAHPGSTQGLNPKIQPDNYIGQIIQTKNGLREIKAIHPDGKLDVDSVK